MLELKCGFLYSKSESRRAPSETAEQGAQVGQPQPALLRIVAPVAVPCAAAAAA
jgi:hypothetical protein